MIRKKIDSSISRSLKNTLRPFTLLNNLAWVTTRGIFSNKERTEAFKIHCKIGREQKRYDVINLLLNSLNRDTTYLEIGVRDPDDNFNLIEAHQKFSVDPGIEFKSNPVDFPYTSDDFFEKLTTGEILDSSLKFDVIFIDGLHLASQVDRDIQNSLNWLKEDGFIVLHDCNPPTEWHARECYEYRNTPAVGFWNGTTWKAFLKHRSNPSLSSCCVDIDFGIGVISKTKKIGSSTEISNEFYDYWALDERREEWLGLVSFQTFREKIGSAQERPDG